MIVERGRRGICYELNGLFGWLLEECGFDVERLAARVISPEEGSYGPPGGHQPLLVSLDGSFLEVTGDSQQERSISEREWGTLLDEEFDIRYHAG